MDPLRAGTVNAADLLGTADRGELAGKAADIVMLPGNPLKYNPCDRSGRFVMKAGKVQPPSMS
jgi:imidazolonepropionase-like amidohydrolase